MNVLVFNAGSSSLKFSLFQADDEHLLVGGGIDWSSEPTQLMLRHAGMPGTARDLPVRTHDRAVTCILRELRNVTSRGIDGGGHRVVHGGAHLTAAHRITPDVRRRACEGLNFVGIELNEQANLRCKPDTDIASPESAARVLVIATREDLTIVRDARRQLARTNLESPHPLTK